MEVPGILQDIRGIIRHGNRATVEENGGFRADLVSGLGPFINQSRIHIQLEDYIPPDGAACRQAEMTDDKIDAKGAPGTYCA